MPEQDGRRQGASLGELVRAAREGAGMSVEQVSAATRIRSALVRDLERGVTATSGGDVYARGHLRAIARATGADPAPLLDAHAREAGAPPPAPVQETEPLLGQRAGSLHLPRPAAPERRTPRWGLAGVAAATVLVGLLAVGTVLAPDDGTADALGTPSPAPSPSAAPPAATVPPDITASVPPQSGAALRLRVIGGQSWVNVEAAGGDVLFEGVLPDGTARDFADPAALSITVGNAGAVSLLCGGVDSPAGEDGQVRRFTCAPGGLAPA